MVMPVPSTIDTMIVRLATTSAVGGSCRPRPDSSASRPFARAMPSRTPPSEAMSPTIADSTITEVITCRRRAPSARNSASSRLRWLTTMLNVLKMMNAPTNSATNPKIKKNVRRKPRPWPT